MSRQSVRPSSTGAAAGLLSRRAFLQGMAGSITAAALAASVTGAAQASDEASGDGAGILIDLTRCTGCQSCVRACQIANDRPNAEIVPTKLSSDAYTYAASVPVTGSDGKEIDVTVKRQCMHCLHPACVSACTVGALRKSTAGPVVYDAQKCIGCRYCQYACPFGVPAYDWDNPLGLIHKCQMCASRLAQGQLPACVQACPNGALRAGSRQALLAQAHGQIASNPERYVDHIYGEIEAGGTSVLYLSGVPFAELGFPVLGAASISGSAETIMRRTPAIALTVASLATTLHLLTRLRNRHAQLAHATVTTAARPADDPKGGIS